MRDSFRETAKSILIVQNSSNRHVLINVLQKLLNCLLYCFNNIKLDTIERVSMHIVFTFLSVANYELRQLIFNNVLDTRVKACLYSLHWSAYVAECQGATTLRMCQHGGVTSDAREV
ncbi:hypothetical protein K0M31_002212 [Melipona bicolor]|uniref:Uncharacterized protein n=1 Tax=Melipona bicolor TaxID=60889 RepID=A0AA40KYZ2_9HYME|nr:hypothetical protein K0M31_002212 [Melipona bicolor]